MKNQQLTKDIITLQQACFCFARVIISSKQVLTPFATFLDTNDEIIIEDPELKSENNRIEDLTKRLNRLLDTKKIERWLLCYDGLIHKKGAKTSDAICIEIRDKNKSASINLYFPYSWNQNQLSFTQPISEKE